MVADLTLLVLELLWLQSSPYWSWSPCGCRPHLIGPGVPVVADLTLLVLELLWLQSPHLIGPGVPVVADLTLLVLELLWLQSSPYWSWSPCGCCPHYQ